MADNVNVTPGAGATLAADEIGGVLYPRTKFVVGDDGTNDGDISANNPMPVYLSGQVAQNPVTVTGSVTTTPSAFGQQTMDDCAPVVIASNQTAIPVTVPVGQAAMAASTPVVIASDQSAVPVSGSVTAALPAALNTTYTQAGVITINTVLKTLDMSLYRGVSIQCVSMGTTGVVTPEWSNDSSTWVAASLFTSGGAAVATFNAAGLWNIPASARYLRLRLSTATTAGTTTINVYQWDHNPQQWYATQAVSGTVTATVANATIAAGTAAIGDVGVQYRASATGAGTVTNINSPATPAGQTIKGSAGRLLGMTVSNTNAAVRYMKIFNATAVTPGTTSALTEFAIPPNQTVTFRFEGGMAFATGIMIMVTAAQGLTNNGAVTGNEVNGFTVHA